MFALSRSDTSSSREEEEVCTAADEVIRSSTETTTTDDDRSRGKTCRRMYRYHHRRRRRRRHRWTPWTTSVPQLPQQWQPLAWRRGTMDWAFFSGCRCITWWCSRRSRCDTCTTSPWRSGSPQSSKNLWAVRRRIISFIEKNCIRFFVIDTSMLLMLNIYSNNPFYDNKQPNRTRSKIVDDDVLYYYCLSYLNIHSYAEKNVLTCVYRLIISGKIRVFTNNWNYISFNYTIFIELKI